MKILSPLFFVFTLFVSSFALSNDQAQNAVSHGKPFAILESEIDSVAASVEELESWVAGLQIDFNNLEYTVSELDLIVDGLESSVSHLSQLSCSSGKIMAGTVYQNGVPTAVCVDDGYALGQPFMLTQSMDGSQGAYSFSIYCPSDHMMIDYGWAAAAIGGNIATPYYVLREGAFLGIRPSTHGIYTLQISAVPGYSPDTGATAEILCAPKGS